MYLHYNAQMVSARQRPNVIVLKSLYQPDQSHLVDYDLLMQV